MTLTADHPSAPSNGAHPLDVAWTIPPLNLDRLTAAPTDSQSVTVDPSTDKPTVWTTVRAVAPLVLVNGLAVYGQLAYVYEHVAPHVWTQASRIALAIGAAAAVESIALYVGWHAHDALLIKAYATARNLRRASYLIAAVVAAVNYAHFAGEHLAPTPAAIMFGLVSLLSPWLWGLHSRRAQRIQLRKERRIDETGAEFSPERRRHFPIRAWAARRWSIDHGVTDPRAAWEGYNAERRRRLTDRQSDRPTGRQQDRLFVASTTDRPVDSRTDRLSLSAPTALPDYLSVDGPTDNPTVGRRGNRLRNRPTTRQADRQKRTFQRRPTPTAQSVLDPTEPQVNTDRKPTVEPTVKARQNGRRPTGRHTPAAVANAAALRAKYGDRLALSASAMRTELGWSHDRITPAIAAHKAKADLTTTTPNGASK